MHATCASHFIFLHLITLITNYKIPHYTIFFPPPLTISLLGANIFFCPVFKYTQKMMW